MKKKVLFILLSIFTFLIVSFLLMSSIETNGLILNIQNQSNELIEDIDIYLYNSQNKIMLIEINDLKSSDTINKIVPLENQPKNQDFALVIDFITNEKVVGSYASYLPIITDRYEVDINIYNIDSSIMAKIEYKDSFVENMDYLKIK